MKIGPSTEAIKLDTVPAAEVRPGNSSAAPVSPVDQTDKIELSEAGRLKESVEAQPDVRAERVMEIRRAIEEGEFRVNPNEIADKMITEAASLLETISRQDVEVAKEHGAKDPTDPPKPDSRK